MLLYNSPVSGNCYKVRLLLAQLGIDYERREVDVLEVLLKRSGKVVSHDSLQGQVFGSSQDVASNAIEVYVHRLRKILAEAGANVQIHTIRGAGYLMDVAKSN